MSSENVVGAGKALEEPAKLPRLHHIGSWRKINLWVGIVGVALTSLLVTPVVDGADEDTVVALERLDCKNAVLSWDPVAVRTEDTDVLAAPTDAFFAGDMRAKDPEPIQGNIPSLCQKEGTQTVEGEMAPLPKVPTVLVVVSGEPSMAPSVRTNLESALRSSGLTTASVSEIPVLRKKMQLGDVPVNWYSIKEFIPRKRVQFILLAEVQRAGTMNLNYYGRTREMTTATFSLRAVDAETGVSAATPASGTVKFTSLNMEEQIRKSVGSAASGMGPDLKQYWRNKRETVGEAG